MIQVISRLRSRGSAAGNLITLLLLVGIIGLGVYLWLGKGAKEQPTAATPANTTTAVDKGEPDGDAPAPIEPVVGTPPLEAAATYTPKDGVLQIDISEYAGYGGLIVANGGLEPNPESFFAKEYGFKVKISMSESETWSPLNNGRLAATATTTDALAVLGRQFDAVVPVQIGYSRGADMVVVDRGVASVNQLAGKVLGASQFNESEFFIRYLAQEAGLPVVVLRDLDARPASSELGLVFYEDAFVACDAYEHELGRAQPRLNGCVGWTPRTDEVVEKSSGKAKVLVSNRNLLVIADVLAVNRGFAKEHPDMVRGLVHGILEGNRRLRDQQAANIGVVAKAFKWSEDEARDELAHVHLANLPENLAFFAGTIDSAGSFGGIFQSSVLAYGELLKNPTDAARFADTSALDALAKKGLFADQRISIAPIKTAVAGLAGRRSAAQQGHPLLLRAELVGARQGCEAEPRLPRHDQALPAGQPRLDRAAARPRRQCARRRIPRARRRAAGEEHGAQGDGAVAPARAIGERSAARSLQGHRRVAHRSRRPRLGRARGPRQRAEPPRRGAVVHAGVVQSG